MYGFSNSEKTKTTGCHLNATKIFWIWYYTSFIDKKSNSKHWEIYTGYIKYTRILNIYVRCFLQFSIVQKYQQ